MALVFRKGLLEKHDAKKVAGIYNALGLCLIGRASKQLFHVGTVIGAVCNTLFQQVVAQAHIFRIAESKGCKRSQYVVVASPTIGHATIAFFTKIRWQVDIERHRTLPTLVYLCVIENRTHVMVARYDDNGVFSSFRLLEFIEEVAQGFIGITKAGDILLQHFVVLFSKALIIVISRLALPSAAHLWEIQTAGGWL